MGDTDAMRPAGPPRPPFPGGMPPRPMGGPRPGGPPMAGGPGAGVRPGAPPPLRTMDSRGNLLMGNPGVPSPQRPGGPPQNPQQRPPPPLNSGGPQSPTGQGGPRPQGAFPWPPQVPGQQQQQSAARPPNPYPGNQAATRPPFNRPPGAPGGPPQSQQQPQPQTRPPAPQQQQQQPQSQQQQQQQPQRPPSSLSNNDDDDVIMGQAVTPQKTVQLKNDPMGPALNEADEDAAYKDDSPASMVKTSDLSLVSPDSLMNDSSISKSISGEVTGSISKGDNDSGVDESTQEKERNGPGTPSSPAKTPTSVSSKPEKSATSRPPSTTPSNKSSKSRSTSRNRIALKTPEPEPVKKVPMNKIQVGHAPSPNLKAVRSKIGSLENASYKPGGGNVKIETKKIEIKAAPKIEAKNDKYTPRGGEKKIISTKLQWNAKSKIGSLENANHKPGGGDKKIETIKPDFKEKAKPKVGSKDNVKHVAGGGDIKIQTQKIEIKAQSKIGSLDNVKHKPGGGDKKIFDDKDYLKNIEHGVPLTTPPSQSSQGRLIATIHLEFGLCTKDCHYWKAPKMQRSTTLSASMSLPAECLVLSVSMPSLNNEQKRPKSAGPKKKPGQVLHPKPFRLY
ncbi:microtubule-associated protein tau-like isoform X2 [Musca vetustissima]|uniref:microtubule-associated protein tau-like isoform X2 n=1 Tax=Musca vetustissima TaxID=27455 RepID=UPI002AB66ABD|nr:microtubule-associated protein tau-like isoform X2 [Musca vetustissima]